MEFELGLQLWSRPKVEVESLLLAISISKQLASMLLAFNDGAIVAEFCILSETAKNGTVCSGFRTSSNTSTHAVLLP